MPKKKLKTVKRLITMTLPASRWVDARSARLGITASEFVRRVLDEKRERGRRGS